MKTFRERVEKIEDDDFTNYFRPHLQVLRSPACQRGRLTCSRNSSASFFSESFRKDFPLQSWIFDLKWLIFSTLKLGWSWNFVKRSFEWSFFRSSLQKLAEPTFSGYLFYFCHFQVICFRILKLSLFASLLLGFPFVDLLDSKIGLRPLLPSNLVFNETKNGRRTPLSARCYWAMNC